MISVPRLASLIALCSLAALPQLNAQWTQPTAEELSMTSIPEVPGAPAVILFYEQTADDGLHMHSYYTRLKVLTEGGKDRANIELPYYSGASGMSLDSISGRTIQPDGTIVPFTGKPYEKVVEKTQEGKIKVKVFSLPAVQVGSIIEYRYKMHLDDHYFDHPDWMVQTDLFTRKAHYMWRPTDLLLTTDDGKQVSESVAWTPILPLGTKVVQRELIGGADRSGGGHIELTLDAANIAPLPREQYMPPMRSLSYRVMFYYTSFRTVKDYWASEGKRWSKSSDKFIGPGSAVKTQVASLVSPSDTPDAKLRKIYAAVAALENTDFTREHTSSEEKAAGLKTINTADDVLTRKRGSGDQLAALFVSMARAAGLKAYLMGVANRQQRVFLPAYLSLRQLDDDIAIVNVDGKDLFFDPGERYCAYGHLAWKHALTGGLRQTDSGVDLSNTPGTTYKDAHVSRIADLTLDDTGVAEGTVTVSYTGDSALSWRQEALRGDDTSLNTDLRTHMEHMLPGGMEVRVTKVDNLTDPEQPLKITYGVKGRVGSATGKRILVPANLFEANSKPKFPEPKRDLPVDMHYPSYVQDAVRFHLPASLVVETAPAPAQGTITGSAVFTTSTNSTPGSITLFRNLTVGKTMFGADLYPDLRGFYSKIEAKDQETLVLTRATAAAPGAAAPAASAKATTPGGN